MNLTMQKLGNSKKTDWHALNKNQVLQILNVFGNEASFDLTKIPKLEKNL